MKTSTFFVLGAASLASAQSIGQLVGEIPTCADSCLLQYIPQVCPKGVTDYACSCNPANKSKITTLSTPCIVKACGVQQGLKVQSVTNQICSVEAQMGSGSSSASSSMSSSMAASSMSSSMASMSSMASSMASSSMASSTPAMMTTAAMSTPAASVTAMGSTGAAAGSGPMITAAPAIAAAAIAMLAL